LGFINQQKLGETLAGGEMRKWMIESARIWILSVQIVFERSEQEKSTPLG